MFSLNKIYRSIKSIKTNQKSTKNQHKKIRKFINQNKKTINNHKLRQKIINHIDKKSDFGL